MYKIIGADGKEYGPVTAEQLKQWIAESRVDAQTKILVEGATDWKPLKESPQLSDEFLTQGFQTIGAAPVRRTSPHALIGMILGILAISVGLCCCYGFPFNVCGLVFSILGLIQIRKNPDQYSGKGLAVTGLILSVLSILLVVGLIVFGVTVGWEKVIEEVRNLGH